MDWILLLQSGEISHAKLIHLYIELDWIYCESGEAHANQRQRGVAEDPDLSNEADRAGVAGMQ